MFSSNAPLFYTTAPSYSVVCVFYWQLRGCEKINRPDVVGISFQVAHKHTLAAAEITILPPPLLSFLQAADAGGGGGGCALREFRSLNAGNVHTSVVGTPAEAFGYATLRREPKKPRGMRCS